MNVTEEISKYKNILNETWEFGKGVYDKAPVKTVSSSSTNGPMKNIKPENKEPMSAKLAPVKKEEIAKPVEFKSPRDKKQVKKPGPFAKKTVKEEKEDHICCHGKCQDISPATKKDGKFICKKCGWKCSTEAGKEVNEAWDKEMKTPESKKGMFKGKTKAELRSELSAAKERSKKLHDADKPEPESLKTKIKELEFALRAKNKFGKVSESADLRKCKGCGEMCKSKYCSDKCKDEYLDRVEFEDMKDYQETHKKKKVSEGKELASTAQMYADIKSVGYNEGYNQALKQVWKEVKQLSSDEGTDLSLDAIHTLLKELIVQRK
jgi:hypothetical protein